MRPTDKKQPGSVKADTSELPSDLPIEKEVWSVESLLRLPEVIRRTGMCKAKIYTQEGFPKPIKAEGCTSSFWIESEVDAWIAQTIAEGRRKRAG